VSPRGQRGNGRRQRRRPVRCRTRTAAEAATVTKSGGRLGERPLQEKGGGYDGGRHRERAAVTGGRHRKRAAAMSAAVAGSGRHRRPLSEAGGGDGSGRHTNNALRQDASTHARGTRRDLESRVWHCCSRQSTGSNAKALCRWGRRGTGHATNFRRPVLSRQGTGWMQSRRSRNGRRSVCAQRGPSDGGGAMRPLDCGRGHRRRMSGSRQDRAWTGNG
jgi:hypothetical protein